jgi:CBS domain-containing protein
MAELPKEKFSATRLFYFYRPYDGSRSFFRTKKGGSWHVLDDYHRQVLQTKGHDYFALSPQATAYEALEIMADKEVGALLVIEGGKLAGIFSERDYARKVILKGKTSKSTTVGELMSSPPICADPALTLRDCMALMTANHIRHLPIMDKGEIIGIVSMGDIVKTIICEQDSTIQVLENYVTGNDYGARVYCP